MSLNDRSKDDVIEAPIKVEYAGQVRFDGPFVKPIGQSSDICIGCSVGRVPIQVQDSFTCISNPSKISSSPAIGQECEGSLVLDSFAQIIYSNPELHSEYMDVLLSKKELKEAKREAKTAKMKAKTREQEAKAMKKEMKARKKEVQVKRQEERLRLKAAKASKKEVKVKSQEEKLKLKISKKEIDTSKHKVSLERKMAKSEMIQEKHKAASQKFKLRGFKRSQKAKQVQNAFGETFYLWDSGNEY